MESDKTQSGSAAPGTTDQSSSSADAPANPEAASDPNSSPSFGAPTDDGDSKPTKKLSVFKKFAKRFNVYLLLFVFLFVVGGVVIAVSLLNKNTPTPSSGSNQNLTQGQLKQLTSSNVSLGGTGQTLSVQGNAIFSGQVSTRSDLNVTGAIQLGGGLSAGQLTVSNSSNLSNTQVSSLQVASTSVFQGLITVQNGINAPNPLASSSLSGSVSIASLTAAKVAMSNDAQFVVPNHLSLPGTTPHLSVNPNGQAIPDGNASINGSDNSGTVTINPGGGPNAGCMVGVTFNKPFQQIPHVIVAPTSSSASTIHYYITRSQTSFSICSAEAPPANQQLTFSYFITD